ncbi:MAG: DNA cytosine methyltransferase [Alphaproteobacteria bacterium]
MKPTLISLFSGAGGMDLGFKKAGFDIIWANDNFLDATETYKINIGHEIDSRGIEEIPVESLPKVDVVVGGFPCQGFSVANTKRTVDDKRNTLYRYFIDTVKATKPKIFVAENVKGILSLGDGEVIKKIVNDFADCGYEVRHHLFNTADYGVPQTRQRVIIFGVRKDLNLQAQFPPAPTHSRDGGGRFKKYVTIGEILEKIPNPDTQHDLKNHVYSKFKQKFNGYISNRVVDPNKPSPTVTARGDEKGGAMIINHPFAPRRLSCRELASVQSFPLDFEFYGSMTSIYRQIGNAVPPLFAETIARVVRDTLTHPKVYF